LKGGMTEALAASDAAHVRLGGEVGASVDAAPWLNFGGYVEARYDRHQADARGSDDGFLVSPELSTRLAFRFADLGLGVEGAVWLPGGAEVGDSFSGLSADGRLLLSGYSDKLVVSGFGGYRFDRSSEAAGRPERLRFGDRSALGLSEYDAILAGIGVGYRLGPTELFGESTARLLLGGPSLSESPIFVSLGMRRQLGAGGLSLQVSLDALVSSHAELSATAALVPIEPRVMLCAGLRYRSGRAAPAATTPRPVEKVVEKPPAPPAPAPPVVELQLVDDRGQPLRNAKVVLLQESRETPLTEAEPGRYRLEPAPSGKARLRITADGFQPIERDLQLASGAPVHLDVKAEQALPAGQVRGLVRSFKGKVLAGATVRVEPGGLQVKTDAEGFFTVDVPPGDYEVVIEAEGFEPQRRKANVQQQGVVIVNADLGKKQ
jgi:hypothetical protein